MSILKKMSFIRNEKYLDLSICITVSLVHMIALFVIFAKSAPQLTIGAPVMQIVSLGDLNLGKANLSTKLDSITLYEPEPQIKQLEEILTIKSEENVDIFEKPKQESIRALKQKPATPKKKKSIKKTKKQTTTLPSTSSGEEKTNNSLASAGGQQAGDGHGETMATHLGNALSNPQPPYPRLSIENRETGRVRLQVIVEADGRPSLVKLIKSSGYPRLDRSALKTVKEQYRFKPASRLGVPIKSNYTFTITFDLNQL